MKEQLFQFPLPKYVLRNSSLFFKIKTFVGRRKLKQTVHYLQPESYHYCLEINSKSFSRLLIHAMFDDKANRSYHDFRRHLDELAKRSQISVCMHGNPMANNFFQN